MNAYNSRSASIYKTQNNTINGTETMINPYGGERGTVQGGYNQYYMNANGEYIGTNDAFHNSNLDPNVSGNYQQVQPQNYNPNY